MTETHKIQKKIKVLMDIYIWASMYMWRWLNINISVHCFFHTHVSQLDYTVYYILWHLYQDHWPHNSENWDFLPACKILGIWGCKCFHKIFPLSNLFQWNKVSHQVLPYRRGKNNKRITCRFIAEYHTLVKVPQNNSSASDSGTCF